MQCVRYIFQAFVQLLFTRKSISTTLSIFYHFTYYSYLQFSKIIQISTQFQYLNDKDFIIDRIIFISNNFCR